jgi:diguanylate cyclase (GGDEF)-like protein
MKPLSAPAPASNAATATSPELRRRLRRTGVIVVGGSILATLGFVHIAMTLFGGIVYLDAMIAALIIPLVVASLAFSWIAKLTHQLEASRRDLERLANEDPLTRLANRRAAMARLAEWSGNGSRPICLAIADIDFFKRVNDRLGHDGGDASLVHFAAMLRRMLPNDWLVARIGGEEFLIAARTDDFATFAARIEALRVAVAETPLITPAGPWQLTSSFGLAEQPPGEAPRPPHHPRRPRAVCRQASRAQPDRTGGVIGLSLAPPVERPRRCSSTTLRSVPGNCGRPFVNCPGLAGGQFHQIMLPLACRPAWRSIALRPRQAGYCRWARATAGC